jgi:hypothetical protein
MALPYFLWMISLLTLEDEDRASKHINAIMALFLMVYGSIYEKFDFKKKMVIYDQTLLRLKKEGLKFLNKKYDDRYGDRKRPKTGDKLEKFISKINTKIDFAIIKFEDYGDMGEQDIDSDKDSQKYKEDNYNGYGGYFFDINNHDKEIERRNKEEEIKKEHVKYNSLSIEDIELNEDIEIVIENEKEES